MTTPIQARTGAEDIVWDLSDLFASPDDPAIESSLVEADRLANVFAEKYRGHVATLSAQEIATALEYAEKMIDLSTRVEYYAHLNWTTDTANPVFGALVQRVEERSSQLQQKTLFFDLEWANADDAHADAVLSDPAVARFKHHLVNARKMRPHQLSEAEEKILSEKTVTGAAAWGRLFGETLSSVEYEFDGQKLPQDVVLRQLYSPDRERRKRAADAVTAGLKPNLKLATYIHNVLAADKFSNDKLRKFPDWISSRNLANEASDESVKALITAVTSRYDIVARYYNIKKQLLGLDELYEYDRYAPIEQADTTYTWAQAQEIVVNAFKSFTPEVGDIAGEFFDKKWIHAQTKPGKRGGAYAAPVTPSLHPYVFINFAGIGRDVMTLAHELGHGVHMYLSRKQSIYEAGTPLTTAETASVFGEFLVFNDLMGRETNPRAKISMLANKIEDSFATVFRQISMNRFEEAIHTTRREKGELTTEQINAAWMETQRAMFPGGVTLRDEYATWWSYIPHFINTPGYVYAYAFGHLLVMALLAEYKKQGESFKPKYLEMLSAGGSQSPDEIVAKVGINLNDPNFWIGGVSLIEEMVVELEALVKSISN